MQVGSEPEFLIEGQFLSCENIQKAAFAEISACFAAPSQDGLDNLPYPVARWP